MEMKRVLLVEDNKIAAKVAKQLLMLLGCQVDDADDGDKAISLALTNSYHGICLDLGLPSVSGIEVCKTIRAYEERNNLKSVPIIAITGTCGADEAAEYLEIGIQYILIKPFTEEKAKKFLSLCN